MSNHTWRLDDDGSRAYIEQGGFHGGPYCTTCDEYFCEHEPNFDENAECPGPDITCAAVNGEWTCFRDLGHDGAHSGVRTFEWS